MLGITFSAEAEPSAAERISDCFQYFDSSGEILQSAGQHQNYSFHCAG